MERSTEVSCLNSYTRAARTLRLVCRFWKKLVDLPSSFYLRATIATLKLDIGDDRGELKVEITSLLEFRRFIQEASSLIFVSFRIFEFLRSVPSYTPTQIQMLTDFFTEIQRVPLYQSRLYSLHMQSSRKEVIDAFLAMSEGLISAPYMTFLSFASNVSRREMTADVPIQLPQLPPLAGMPEMIPSESLTTPIFSLFYRLKIMNLCGELTRALPLIKAPPNLSSLHFNYMNITLHHLHTILELCCERLEELTLSIASIRNFEEEREYHSRPTLRMSSLTYLDATSDIPTLDCFMTMMELPRLKHASLDSDFDSELMEMRPGTHGRRITKTCSLPKLRELILLFGQVDPPLFLINAMSDIPKLKRLMISGTTDATLEQISIDTRRKLLDLRFEELILQDTYTKCVPVLLGMLNCQEVQDLMIYISPDSFWYIDPSLPHFKAHFPNLTRLQLTSENPMYLAQCLRGIYFGDKLTALTFDLDSEEFIHLDSAGTIRRSEYAVICSKWDEITSGASSRFSEVIAVATTWPAQFRNYTEVVYRICKNTRTLVTKIVSERFKGLNPGFIHPLLDLYPSLTNSNDIIMPSLETIYYLCDNAKATEWLNSFWGLMANVIKNDLLKINGIRQLSRASMIRTLVLIFYADSREPGTVVFYQDNEVTIRFEFIKKHVPGSLDLFEDIHV